LLACPDIDARSDALCVAGQLTIALCTVISVLNMRHLQACIHICRCLGTRYASITTMSGQDVPNVTCEYSSTFVWQRYKLITYSARHFASGPHAGDASVYLFQLVEYGLISVELVVTVAVQVT
jgi:hypothetical protein